MRTLRPADHVYAFYGRDGARFSAQPNWIDAGALSLGIASYAIVDRDEALHGVGLVLGGLLRRRRLSPASPDPGAAQLTRRLCRPRVTLTGGHRFGPGWLDSGTGFPVNRT